MEPMREFVLWCLDVIPPVLLEPPISAFTGLALLIITLRVIYRMMHLV